MTCLGSRATVLSDAAAGFRDDSAAFVAQLLTGDDMSLS
jgi:hypothetical protein